MTTIADPNAQTVLAAVQELAAEWTAQRADRQRRTSLDPADFDALRQTGLLRLCLPEAYGGLWQGLKFTGPVLCEAYRAIAHADSSLALVSSMHPAVMAHGMWFLDPHIPAEYRQAWDDQCAWVFGTVVDGAWWGTTVSEPGSGGDTARTVSGARRDPTTGEWRMSGLKHFGSGSGVLSYMITEAQVPAEEQRDLFVLDMRGVPFDGSRGVTLVAPWAGHGMTATQSHSLRFEDFPAIRSAVPHEVLGPVPGGLNPCMWAGIITGIVETAVETARQQLTKRPQWRPYEQVEWTRVQADAWLIEQAYEGMVRNLAADGGSRAGIGKLAIAELAETAMQRLCRVVGGGAFTRYSPYGYWFEDVRALGFLRPPWGLAYDRLWETGHPNA